MQVEPKHLGLACAAGAVGLGIVYLAAAGAPVRLVAMNLAAFAVGLAAYATVTGPQWRLARAADLVLPGLALALLATALLGTRVEGAARWVAIGPLNLQLSLILLPAMLVSFARRPGAAGAVGLGLAALALALQPDRAMAGALTAALLALALGRRSRWDGLALAAALAAFAATLVQADNLPATPFVDQIFYSSFAVHPAVGAGVIVGTSLLLIPALTGIARPAEREAWLAFGALWFAVALAAALGNYPTPLVGYGGSAIVGYLLSLSLVPRVRRAEAAPSASSLGPRRDQDGPSLAVSLA